MVIFVMGVAGAGKTTVGSMLAAALQCAFLDADTLHPPESVAAMSRGVPLVDAEREPWLQAVHAHMRETNEQGQRLVVGCSALRLRYREALAQDLPVVWLYLRGSRQLIRERLRARAGHFADERLLESQLALLEEPGDAIVMDVDRAPDAIVRQVLVRVCGARGLHVVDAEQLGVRAAAAAATIIREVVADMGRCSVVLSGGHTPRGLHRALATRERDNVPWQHVHVFWSDERYVPADDPRNNYRMARETLLDHVPVIAANIHPMPTTFDDPKAAALDYEATLVEYFRGAPPSFDLAILGMGADGHTASLFPHTPDLEQRDRRVLAVRADAEPPRRLTLTLPVLLAAARSWFLVDRAEKAAPVRRVLSGSADARALPAAAVMAARGSVTWWLDAPAASLLDPAWVCAQQESSGSHDSTGATDTGHDAAH